MTTANLKEPLKNLIRQVLNEVTIAPSSISRSHPEPRDFIEKLSKALKSVCADKASVDFDEKSGKIVLSDCDGGNKFTVKIETESDGIFKVTSIVNGSERLVKINQSKEDVISYVKSDIKKMIDDPSYIDKAYDKNAIPEKGEKSKKEESDECVEVKDVKKQIDHKPVDQKDRKDEEILKGTSGMEVSKDGVKQIDAESKEKVKLKSEKSDASEEDVVQKLKSTPSLKKQNVKESMERFYKKKLDEVYDDTHSFTTKVSVKINETVVRNVDVTVEYVISKKKNVVEIKSITSNRDIPSHGISVGQVIKESEIVNG